ncbi:hypothetical protein [Candidatus Spongiihabitans sp.]|uniref:hypothetical protein n=1 Tax=Candidatus Spongiihabitans sp. TaxID=3101308 RepID=UPI003C7CB156
MNDATIVQKTQNYGIQQTNRHTNNLRNPQCKNFDRLVNVVTEVDIADMDLFYEGYDGSEDVDYCQICGELGVAEDPILL